MVKVTLRHLTGRSVRSRPSSLITALLSTEELEQVHYLGREGGGVCPILENVEGELCALSEHMSAKIYGCYERAS